MYLYTYDAPAGEGEAPFVFRSWYLFIGPVCLTLVLLLGWWLSFGIHVSVWPLYIDVHFLWFIFTIQSKARGEYQKSNDSEWQECQAEEARMK